ncbi:MAG: PAS domain S-box protein [Thermoleophilia bacterium]
MFEAILNASQSAIAWCTPEGVLTGWSPAAERALGWPEEVVLGGTLPFVAPDALPTAVDFVAEVAAGAERRTLRLPARRADGGGAIVDVSAVPLPDGAGVVLSCAVTRQSEDERRLRLLVSRTPVGLFQTDRLGRCTFVNERWCEISGMTMDEAIGEGWAKNVHPDDRHEVFLEWMTAAASEREFSREYRYATPDGRTTWVFGSASPLFDEDGELRGYLGSLSDITEQKALREDNERVAALVMTLIESLNSGVLVEDEARQVQFVNQVICNDFGLGAEREALVRMDGNDVLRLMTPLLEDGERFVELIERHAESWEHLRGEELRFVDGRVFELDHVPFLVGNAGGHLWHYRDITERKRIELELAAQNEQLRELDKLKDEFVAMVTHELRSPVTSVLGYLDLVLEDEELGDEQRHFVGVARRNAQRLLRLVGDLLFIARVQAGKFSLEPERMDLAQVISECVESQRPRAESKCVSVLLDAPASLPLVGDPARLSQLADNLVSNAIKFTLEGGDVRVRLSEEAGTVRLEVADSGIGIPAAEQEKLFQRFFRASTATSQRIQGTGLGLTITKTIAEGHGGTISFTSEVGVGTTFVVELPLVPAVQEDGRRELAA